MQHLADQLVRDVWPVEIAGVDVVYATRDRLAQHGYRCITILGRPKHARARELHGAIAEPLHDPVPKGKGAGLIDCGHDRSPLKTMQS